MGHAMDINLEVQGPFEIPFARNKQGKIKFIRRSDARAFWGKNEVKGIKSKNGCYVFALRAGKGFTPWYVGKASKEMAHECFMDHKLQHYNEVIAGGRAGTPVMLFVVPPGTKNKLPKKMVDDLETFLIQSALYKNEALANVQKTGNRPKWGIVGVVRGGKGKPSVVSRAFRLMMGL